jgi:hypothetical protein
MYCCGSDEPPDVIGAKSEPRCTRSIPGAGSPFGISRPAKGAIDAPLGRRPSEMAKRPLELLVELMAIVHNVLILLSCAIPQLSIRPDNGQKTASDCSNAGWPGVAKTTIDSPPRCSPHFRRDQAAVCSYVDAEMGCINYLRLPRFNGHAAAAMVIGAYGDSTVRSDVPGGA